MNPIITLTTDFGNKDYYIALLKGAILTKIPTANIIDIVHTIQPFDIVRAAFMVRNVYTHFPKGSIHLVSVNNFYAPTVRFLVTFQHGHYFIAPDNGIFSLVFDKSELTNVYGLTYIHGSDFPLKHVFSYLISNLILENNMEKLGDIITDIDEKVNLQPVIGKNRIRGSVIHIDNYENVILNINRTLFNRILKKRPFSLHFKRHDAITTISNNYSDVPVGDTVCLFNSADYLEIAINMGKASSLLGLEIDDIVQIDIKEDE